MACSSSLAVEDPAPVLLSAGTVMVESRRAAEDPAPVLLSVGWWYRGGDGGWVGGGCGVGDRSVASPIGCRWSS
eukprot:2024700-Pyramimonas_sp.AAC.1